MKKVFAEVKKKKLKIGVYPYTYARISAMKSKLLSRDDYNKLLKMKISEIARFLQEMGYKKEIDELGVRYAGVELLEHSLKRSLVRDFIKLKIIAEDDNLRQIMVEYMKRNDIYNIKTIIRGKFTGENEEKIKELLVPVGVLDEAFLLGLLKKDFEEILKIAQSLFSIDNESFKEAYSSLKENNSLFEIENLLDHTYYSQFFKFADRMPVQGNVLKEFIENEIDTLNIAVLMRLKKEGMAKKDIEKYLFYAGAKITKEMLRKLSESENLKEFLDRLSRISGFGFVRQISEKEDYIIEILLKKRLLNNAILLLHKNPLTIDIILGYMFAKEIEIRNLMTIIKGKQLGFEESVIEKELVIG
ncbi:MAG: ATP synthase A1 subunit C [Candidatus Woesearchaeota archaeon]|nr:ATP synthase A1 subunit C [Candidatus Woesearchaeota archaeon]